jgi:TonB family protein
MFSGSSAMATTSLPAAKVQTGGFGDPNGLPPDPGAHGGLKIGRVGSFDLPAGDGRGNGTGGAQGARATVASAGFGNGVAGPGVGTGGGGDQRVRESGFGAATAAAPALRRVASVQPALTPAEIVAKPQPAYTAEARANRVEGEVVLQVVFGADGKLRVVRVVRGLGYGLDEAAAQAAQQIRFKPAQRNGQPVDSTARIHITFQLA